MRDGHARGRGGLTLVEFLFAISVMAVVALGVVGMFPSAVRSVVSGGELTKATLLAQEMADMMRTELFDVLYLTPTSGTRFQGYVSFDTRNLPSTCAAPVTDSCRNKKKWQADLAADDAQSGGRGLPAAYGTVTVTCRSVNTSAPYTLGSAACDGNTRLVQLSVTVFWRREGQWRSLNMVTHVARNE